MPCAAHPASCTFVCYLIKDVAPLASAQLSNQQPTYEQHVCRSASVTPSFGSVHLVATLDDVRIHGCRPCRASPTEEIGSLTKVRSRGLCRWCTSTTPCARLISARHTEKIFLHRFYSSVQAVEQGCPFFLPLAELTPSTYIAINTAPYQ